MKKFSIKSIMVQGLALAIPSAIIFYVFIRIIEILGKAISPISKKLGVDKILGEVTLTVLVIGIIALVVFLLGLVMQIKQVAKVRDKVESLLLQFLPSLNYLKVIAADNIDMENSIEGWKPVIIFYEQKYSAAFIIEENNELITFFVSKGISLQDGEVLITNKKEVDMMPVSVKDLYKCSKAFGKGYLSLVTERWPKSSLPQQ